MSAVNVFPLEVNCNVLERVYDPYADRKYALVCKNWNAACKEIDKVVFSQICPTDPHDPFNHAARKKFIGTVQFFRHLYSNDPIGLRISVRGYKAIVVLIEDKHDHATILFFRDRVASAEPLIAGASAPARELVKKVEDWAQRHPEELQGLRPKYTTMMCLPRAIQYFTRLKTLDLEGHHLRFLPKELWGLGSLESLNLSNNDFSEMPSEISLLTGLTILGFSQQYSAGIREVPAQLSRLTKLRILNLMRNNLSEIPQAICGMSSLRFVDLRKNFISKFPYGIYGLPNLRDLSIGKVEGNYNSITLHDGYGPHSEHIFTNMLRLEKAQLNRVYEMVYFIARHNGVEIDPSNEKWGEENVYNDGERLQLALSFLEQCENCTPIDENLMSLLMRYSTLLESQKEEVHRNIYEFDRDRGVLVDDDSYGWAHLDNVDALEYAFEKLST
ncbi:MAG: leucine-rich repeat domain-containing protein [Simkaniaceae bacterium]|nr:leucine-rich repeat domain-containing protein [Simkaniaceae bacterium]